MNKAPLIDSVGVEDWAGAMGDKWLANLERFESMTLPVGNALMKHAAISPGEHVLDVGCGGGGPTIEIGQLVGASGNVLGLDVSRALIDAATRRVRAAQVSNVHFQVADGATVTLDTPPFDRLFSSFGLTFFADPYSAFANLHRLLRRGARVDFSTWAPPRENVWVVKLVTIVKQYVELPTPRPRAPGAFAFDDPLYIQDILNRAGFKAVTVDPWQGDQFIGGLHSKPEETADFVLRATNFGDLIGRAGAAACEDARIQLTKLFKEHETAEGIPMPAKAFLVTAQA